MHKILSSAGIPSRLEPSETDPSNNVRPDGVSIVPWRYGKPLAWDVTCRDTFAPSYLKRSSVSPGSVVLAAENEKENHYRSIASSHNFVPIAVETSGIIGPSALQIFKQISRRLREMNGDPLANYHIKQQVSVCIQRGNAASILGTINHYSDSYFPSFIQVFALFQALA